ncbi:MAG: hypothetical protein CMM47_11685 [Rhodospirillaceae bacterium]|nr:hypothetical protein [Rhodospirillaceae bacterium]
MCFEFPRNKGQEAGLSERSTLRGRVMRVPMFDGLLPDHGPIHLVAEDGDQYLLIARPSDTPGHVEEIAAGDASHFERYLNSDISIRGNVLGTVIWQAEIIADRL